MSAVAVLLLAAVLRTVGIASESFWYDEAYSASIIEQSYAELWTGEAKDNGNPPLYWIALKAWESVFGSSEVALRALSAMASIATTVVIIWLAALCADRRTALVTGVLWAMSPWSIFLANETRVYALLQLLAVAATLLFVRWVQRGGGALLAAYAAIVFAACHSHYFGFVVPLAHGLVLGWHSLHGGKARRTLAHWCGAMVAIALVWSYWIPNLWNQMATRGMEDMGRTFLRLSATPLILTFGRTLAWREHGVILVGLASLAAAATLGIAFLAGLFSRTRDPNAKAIVIAWCLIPTAVPFLITALGKPVFQVRYAAVALPAFLIVCARGVVTLRRFPKTVCVWAVVLIALTAVSLGRYYVLPYKDDWRSATEWLFDKSMRQDIVLIDPDHDMLSFRYYLGKTDREFYKVVATRDIPITHAKLPVNVLDQLDDTQTHTVFNPHESPATSLWLILRYPKNHHPRSRYEELLGQAGYSVVEIKTFRNISVLHFALPDSS